MKAKIFSGTGLVAVALLIALVWAGRGAQAQANYAQYPTPIGVSGTITAISGDTLTVAVSTGKTVQVLVNGSTVVATASGFATSSALHVGDRIAIDPVSSLPNTGGSTNAPPDPKKDVPTAPNTSGPVGQETGESSVGYRSRGSVIPPYNGEGRKPGEDPANRPVSPPLPGEGQGGNTSGQQPVTSNPGSTLPGEGGSTGQPGDTEKQGTIVSAHLIWVVPTGQVLVWGNVVSTSGNVVSLKSDVSFFDVQLGTSTSYRTSEGANAPLTAGSSADVQSGATLWVLGTPATSDSSPLSASSVLVQR